MGSVGLTLDKEEKEEEDIELDLGLSIGSRSYKKTKENGLIHDQKSFLQRSTYFNSRHFLEVGPREKREIRAFRRQEAKRKREEKQRVKKRGVFFNNGEEVYNGNVNGNVIRNVVGSPVSTSSAGSDRGRSPSLEAGNGSDTKSNLSQSTLDQPQLNGAKDDDKKEHEYSSTSQQVVPSAACEQTYHVSDTIPSNASPSHCNFPEKHVISATNSAPGLMKLCNGVKGKPPNLQTQNHVTPSLSDMPCVSTTGDGPDGRTVKGFLCRYSKTEVSIICVCHGASFSPAEFVQHAGGTDVTHPLRHIIMIPSAY